MALSPFNPEKPFIQPTTENPDPIELLHKKLVEDLHKSDIPCSKSLEQKRQLSTNKLPVMHFEEISGISGKILPMTGVTGLPSCIVASKHMIIVGSTFGLLSVFSHDGLELKQLKQKSVGSVICIDISDDEQWAIVGYNGGLLCLWDLRSGNCVRSSGNIFNLSIISCKFWKHNKNNVIAADLSGKVALVEYGKSFLTTTISFNYILTGEAGTVVSIEPLFSNPNYPHSTDNGVVVAMACVDRVLVYSLEPENTILLGIERPDEVHEEFLPNISLKFATGPGEDFTTDPILAIGWGTKIFLHKIKFPSPEGIQLIGTYSMDSEIKCLQLLVHDVVLTLSNSREVVILTTKGFCKLPSDTIKDCVLKEIYVNRDIAVQSYIKDSKNKEKYTYYNTISCFESQVFILGNKQAHKGRLLTWKECILDLSKNGDWLEALCLALDFYQGKGTKLYSVPNNKDELKKVFEGVIEKYVQADNISWEYKIANTIEFCVGIESTDFLFNFFYDYFVDEGKGQENLKQFIDVVEPFILNGEIYKIPTIILGKILNFYLINKKAFMIEKIVLQLDSSCLNPQFIFPICEEFLLTSAYIYMSISISEFTKPIDFLYSILQKAESLQKKKFYCYKLLWYLKTCLKGEKFPKGFIPTDQWKIVIINVFTRLLNGDLLEDLVSLDANSTLKVIWNGFQDLVPSQVLEQSKSPRISDII